MSIPPVVDSVLDSAFTDQAKIYITHALTQWDYYHLLSESSVKMTVEGIALMLVMGDKDCTVSMQEFEGINRLCIGSSNGEVPKIGVDAIRRCNIVRSVACMLQIQDVIPMDTRMVFIQALVQMAAKTLVAIDSYTPEFGFIADVMMRQYDELRTIALKKISKSTENIQVN